MQGLLYLFSFCGYYVSFGVVDWVVEGLEVVNESFDAIRDKDIVEIDYQAQLNFPES